MQRTIKGISWIIYSSSNNNKQIHNILELILLYTTTLMNTLISGDHLASVQNPRDH